jgi:ABC-2 type transport system permease protein
MNTWAYTRYELLRTVRNRRFFIFSLAFPLVLFFAIATPVRSENNLADSGISAPLYFMVGLVAFGGMAGMLSTGARIAAERSVGWNRQLRITPLKAFAYFRTKLVTAYLMGALTIAALFISGAILGVSMSAGDWLAMTGLILVGLLPFAALGVLMGHLLTADSVGPALGGSISLFALLGGSWFPIPDHGVLHVIGQVLPSYWLVQASHVSLGGNGWSATGWVVVLGWTVVLTIAAGYAYRRDTARV